MRVLVASDLSRAADAALREGVALASAPADSLAVVHVLPRLHRVSVLDQRLTEAVRARIARVTGRATETFVEIGHAETEILARAEAWQADILVVAGHGHSGISRVLGGVAEHVAGHAHCSVLVVKPSATGGWVLAATDLAKDSPVIAVAAAEAARRGARLEVVHAVGFLDLEATYLLELGSPSIHRENGDTDAPLSELSKAAAGAGVHAECVVLDNPPATAIAREAERVGAELIVVGSKPRTGLERLAIGGVAAKVARIAACSVLVTRAPAKRT